MSGKRTKNFTDTWLAGLKTTEPNEVYYDAQVKGLSIRVSKTGKKTWQVLYRVKGSSAKQTKKIGEYPALKLREARLQAGAFLAAAYEGEDLAAPDREARKAPTFDWLAGEYIERYAKVYKRSWERDLELLERNVLPSWGKRRVSSITRRDVIALLDGIMARMEDGQRGIPANRTLAVLRKLFNWAISRDLVESNPCYQVKAPAQEQARDRVLSDDEIRRVWAALETLGKEPRRATVADALRVMLLTAQRSGEVKAMRWADLDLDSGWWTIPTEMTKNGLSHRVPLSAPTLAILEARKARAEATEASPWVFPARGVDGPLSHVKKTAEKARELSGCDWTPHDLRRTAASHMAAIGIPRIVISKLLNHAEQGVTAVYERYSYDREKREALDAWAERLGVILKAEG